MASATELPELAEWNQELSWEAPLHAEVWIDLTSGYPVALALRTGEVDWFQIFTGFNDELEISVPENLTEMNQADVE